MRRRQGKRRDLPAKYAAGFLAKMDRRTEVYRTLRETREAIVADCGGEAEVTQAKLCLIERFVFLEALLQTWEHQIATRPKDSAGLVGRYTQGVNALVGLARTCSALERRMKRGRLKDYLEERK